MNFFQAQDNARRKTTQLAILFGFAVLSLVILTNLLIAVFLSWAGIQTGLSWTQAVAEIPLDAWIWISLGVLGVVAVACTYKYLTLQGGGRVIAESLGGHLIHQSTRDQKQRQLLNVVEEMAIAAGMAVPPVYLIPEPSINAFAAGFNSDDAVIGINQGTLDLLNRAELQGVVAHEFSHILNGDTNINLRLIAILHGIVFLGMIGYGLMRAGGYSRKNGAPLLILGIGLLIIGYGGTFFGNLIKAGVSRQREYLADASAVQFTRDTNGIADALKKIGGHTYGSTIANPAAEEAAHMFFGAAAPKFAANLMATHPPLDQRIKALDPGWNGQFIGAGLPDRSAVSPGQGRSSPLAAGFSSAAVVQQVGRPTTVSLDVAKQLIEQSPASLQAAAHEPFAASALIYAMLLSHDEQSANAQLTWLIDHAERGVIAETARLGPEVAAIDNLQKLTLFEQAVPALKELSFKQYKQLSSNCAQLITFDGNVELFEWVLHRLLVKELIPHFEGPQSQHGRLGKIEKVHDDAAILLAIIASQAHSAFDQQLVAYNKGANEIGLKQPYAKQGKFDYARINSALKNLRKLKPLVKPVLIKACITTVLADGHINVNEGALLQGIAATLDCPLPPQAYG